MRRTMRRSLILVFLLATLASIARAAERDDGRASCQDRLKRLGRLCLLYAEDNRGQPPPSLAELYYRAYTSDLKLFACPGKPAEILTRDEINAKSGYVLSSPAAGTGVRALVQDRSAANHGNAGINVFYSDGSVRWEPAAGTGTGNAATAAPGAGAPSPPPASPSPQPVEKVLPPLGLTLLPDARIKRVTLCLGLDSKDNPVQPGYRFPSAARKIACRIAYENVPPNTDLTVEWYFGDDVRTRSLGVIEKSGSVISYVYTPEGEPFEIGRYRVEVTLGDRKEAIAHFQVEPSAEQRR